MDGGTEGYQFIFFNYVRLYTVQGWVNLDNPLLQVITKFSMDSRNMPEKFRTNPIMGSVTDSALKIAIFTTYGM